MGQINMEIDYENEKKNEIIKMGKFSFEAEEKREQSLILQSGHMLTGFSIISVMLFAIIPILLNYTQISNRIVFFLIGISLLFLIVSLLFSIAALWRYECTVFDNIESVYNLMINDPLNNFNVWWLKNLNRACNEKSDLNEKRTNLMKISTISFGVSIFAILIYLIALLVYMMLMPIL